MSLQSSAGTALPSSHSPASPGHRSGPGRRAGQGSQVYRSGGGGSGLAHLVSHRADLVPGKDLEDAPFCILTEELNLRRGEGDRVTQNM